jgi:hypothetical protein
MWRKVLNRLTGSRFKTPSKRANVPQHFTQSIASTSWGCSLGEVTHEEVPPCFSWWVPAFRHGTYPSHWNVRSRSHALSPSRSHALSPKSPHLKLLDIIIKYKQNIVKHNSMILLRCILTLFGHVSALVMSHLLDLLDEVHIPYSPRETFYSKTVLIQLFSIKYRVNTSITNSQYVSTKISHMTYNKNWIHPTFKM